MAKKFFILFSCIFLLLILFAIAKSQENELEENAYGQPAVATNFQDIDFLKNKLKLLERIFNRQRKSYLVLLGALEEKNKYIDNLKEQLVLSQKEIFILEREKVILELMANKYMQDLKRPPLTERDDNLDKATHINLGYAYGRKAKLQDAIEEYTQALKYDPEDKNVHYNLGYLLAKKNKYKDAIEEYKKALSGEPSDREIYYNLAIIYSVGLKDKKIADYYYERFLSIPSQEKGSAP